MARVCPCCLVSLALGEGRFQQVEPGGKSSPSAHTVVPAPRQSPPEAIVPMRGLRAQAETRLLPKHPFVSPVDGQAEWPRAVSRAWGPQQKGNSILPSLRKLSPLPQGPRASATSGSGTGTREGPAPGDKNTVASPRPARMPGGMTVSTKFFSSLF